MKFKLSLAETLRHLQTSGNEFETYLTDGSLEVELYQPHLTDKQQPHDRDELYIITTGHATFDLDGEQTDCVAGDLLFVPAHKPHRFIKFSDDFSTWVIFYGSKK